LEESSFDWANPLDRRAFLRSISYREFLSSFVLAIFLEAILTVLSYPFAGDIDINATFYLLVPIFAVINHIWYKRVHRRSNNFIGRMTHDYIFAFSLVIIDRLSFIMRVGGFSTTGPSGGTVLNTITFIILVSAILELCVGILKWILNKIGWPIL
jgi:hypothetical protein